MDFTLTQLSADTVNPQDLRRTLGIFATGVTVVTSVATGGEWVGKTVNSFASVSLSPPLVLFCVHSDSPMLNTLRERRVFAVNILGEEQEEASRAFAGSSGSRFRDITCTSGLTGSPLFDEALGFLECRIVHEYEGGDHAIIVGEVLRTDRLPGKRPLTFFNSQYARLTA